jgi:hypothetical protein
MNSETTEDHLARFMTRAMTIEAPALPNIGSFVRCMERYNGRINNKELHRFILSIVLYKGYERISDETALLELPLLLEGPAAVWWENVKENINNWETAIRMLRETFEQKKPAYEIYAEIFSAKQDEYISTEMFIRQKRELLAQLPQPHPEEVQLDMIYSLLKQKIQTKVPRNSVFSIDQLIQAANNVERKKSNRRIQKYVNFDFGDMKPVLKSKEKCSHCRKSRQSNMENLNMDCYKCDSRQDKRSKRRKAEEKIPVHAPLQGFNPNINPFNKSFTGKRDSKELRQRKS